MFRSRAVSYMFGFGVLLTVLSIPAIMGLARPMFDVHNPYALIYGLLCLPSNVLFQGPVADLAQYLWEAPSMEQTDLLFVFFSVVFWSLVGLVVGIVGDFKYGRKS